MAFLDFNGLSHFLDKIKTIFVSSSLKGTANGIAELDANGKVPSAQLPSFVDDVLEYASQSSFPATGETGKIYIALDTNTTYRWSGSTYVEIGSSLALGETSSTAYRGDRGKVAYDHAVNKGSAFNSGLYKITTNSDGHVTEAATVVKSDITALGIPSSDTTYSDATQSTHGLMSTTDKIKLDSMAGENLYYVVGPSTDTTAGTWTGTINGLTAYYNGLTLIYVPSVSGASTTTLNINNLGAKVCYRTNTTKLTTQYNIGTPILFTYKDDYWCRADYDSNSDTVPSAYCETVGNSASKSATCTSYTALENSYIHVLIRASNTSESAITLNINSTGAKPVYINGTASSSTNYTLPAGTYIVFYDGSNYYFRTDGKLTANITGDAATVNGKTVASNVPANAVFTDTTYESRAAVSGGTDVSLVTTGEKYIWNNKGDGAVTGPVSSVVDHIATFNDTEGKVIKDSGFTIATSVPANAVFTDTTYESRTAASGGTDVSLVTTGEKYNWNNASSNIISGNINGIWYLTCETIPSVDIKDVTISNVGTPPVIPPGCLFIIYFAYGMGNSRDNLYIRINQMLSCRTYIREYKRTAETGGGVVEFPTPVRIVFYFDGSSFYELNDPMSQYIGPLGSSYNNSILINDGGLIKPTNEIPAKYNLKPIIYSATTPPESPTEGTIWLRAKTSE